MTASEAKAIADKFVLQPEIRNLIDSEIETEASLGRYSLTITISEQHNSASLISQLEYDGFSVTLEETDGNKTYIISWEFTDEN